MRIPLPGGTTPSEKKPPDRMLQFSKTYLVRWILRRRKPNSCVDHRVRSPSFSILPLVRTGFIAFPIDDCAGCCPHTASDPELKCCILLKSQNCSYAAGLGSFTALMHLQPMPDKNLLCLGHLLRGGRRGVIQLVFLPKLFPLVFPHLVESQEFHLLDTGKMF